jgi:hypothetical protein
VIESEISSGGPAITPRTLRQFAALWLLFFGGFAIWQALVRHNTTTAIVLSAAALLVGLPGLVKPVGIRAVFKTAMAVTHPVGWVVSHLILGVMFFLVITPIALVFRLTGRDALRRRRMRHRATYWIPMQAEKDPRSYLRQG